MKTNSISLNVHGIKAKIISDDYKFLQFVSNYFNYFVIEDKNNNLDDEKPIVFFIKFSKFFSWKLDNKIKDQEINLGEGFAISSKGDFIFKWNELFVKIDWNKENWQTEVLFKRIFFKHLANILFFKKGKTNENYYRIIARLVIQNLIFLKLYQKYQFGFISGAAITINQNAFLFIGLPGSGKSYILKLIVSKFPQSEIIADNYILFKEKKVFVFPEGKFIPSRSQYPIKSVFIVSYGKKFNLKKIHLEDGLKIILAINLFTKELLPQSPYVNYLIYNPKFEILLNEHNFIKKILENINIYQVTIDEKGEKFLNFLAQNYEKL